MALTIGVIISAHTARVRCGLLSEAINSVLHQERLPDQLVVAIDQDGKGAAATKQRALESIETDYCAVLDSDDMFLPHHLKVLEREILRTNSDMAYSWFETIPPGGDPFPKSFFTDPWDPDNPRHTTTVIMARTDLMKKVGYSQAPGDDLMFADDDLRMTMGLVELGARIHHVPERTWLWRHHGSNTSGLPHKGDGPASSKGLVY